MMIKTQAIYFDGKTSVSQDVELILDSVEKKLSFTATDGNIVIYNLPEIDFETFNGTCKIKFKNEEAHIIVKESSFINEIEVNSKNSIYRKLLGLNFRIYLLLVLIIFSLIIVSYIFITPIITQKAVSLIPVSLDVKLGNLFMGKYAQSIKIDSAKTSLLNEFGKKMILNNKIDLNFIVIKSDTINAFALPNGNIIVFTGLLEKIDNYEVLAALLSHEISHVNKRHSMQILCKSFIGYGFISVLTTDISGLAAVIIENSGRLGDLSYSRDMEQEADNQGMILLEENNINPAGMLELMKILQGIDSKFELEFLSTHPVIEKRLENAKSKIKEKNYPKNIELKKIFDKFMN